MNKLIIFALALQILIQGGQTERNNTRDSYSDRNKIQASCLNFDAIREFQREMQRLARSENQKITFLVENSREEEILSAIVSNKRIVFISCSKEPPSTAGSLSLKWQELPQNLLNVFSGWSGRAFSLQEAK